MKFFITGTTGFIGGTLREHYLAQGHDVTEYVRGESIADALDIAQPDVIVNCAGEIYNPELMYDTNVHLVYTILEWLKHHHRGFCRSRDRRHGINSGFYRDRHGFGLD
jgi:nucleoside-diphosphate-sugar epimerase